MEMIPITVIAADVLILLAARVVPERGSSTPRTA